MFLYRRVPRFWQGLSAPAGRPGGDPPRRNTPYAISAANDRESMTLPNFIAKFFRVAACMPGS